MAASTAPAANPERFLAVCETTISSASESIKAECFPKTEPSRREATCSSSAASFLSSESCRTIVVFRLLTERIMSAARKAVPLGKSALAVWCCSAKAISNCPKGAISRAASRTVRKKMLTPSEKFAEWSSELPASETICLTSSLRSSQPVVPTTIGTPDESIAGRFARNASLTVKSMMASLPSKRSAVMAVLISRTAAVS